uniref:Uncharacterized protein n=1 Tax=Anguilla anguilla TaxID=7936 RepID=A0A0E9XPY7_ANGAN
MAENVLFKMLFYIAFDSNIFAFFSYFYASGCAQYLHVYR